MTFDAKLAGRVRRSLAATPRVREKQMFGGIAFMVNGKMCVTVGGSRLMCRIDPEMRGELLQNPGCEPVVMRGRELKGFVRVRGEAVRTKRSLDYWVGLAVRFNRESNRSQKNAVAGKKIT